MCIGYKVHFTTVRQHKDFCIDFLHLHLTRKTFFTLLEIKTKFGTSNRSQQPHFMLKTYTAGDIYSNEYNDDKIYMFQSQ